MACLQLNYGVKCLCRYTRGEDLKNCRLGKGTQVPGAKRPLMTKSLQLGLWGNHRAKLLLSKLEQEKAVRKRRGKMEVLCWRAGVMCEMILVF